MGALSQYTFDVRDLLRDASGQFYTAQQITRYINRARREVCLHTGCLRVLLAGSAPYGADSTAGNAIAGAMVAGNVGNNNTGVSVFNSIPGTEKYPYQGQPNQLIQQQNAGVKGIIDVLDIAISWGGIRPTLTKMPWMDLQAYARSYNVGVTSYPFAWSTFRDGENGEVWLFPIPSVAAEMEWDCTCVPSDLNTDNDPEAIPSPFTNAVKYYAAMLAFANSGRYTSAELMKQEFMDRMMVDNSASDAGMTLDYYWMSTLP
jgi:hypothetical protein